MSVRARRSRSALSRYEVLEEKKGVSLILLYPETGRTHQLRVHLAAIGHPIVGDPVYGKQQLPPALPEIARSFRRQALHAAAIAFRHPMTEELLMIHAPYAADYAKLLDALQFVTTERQIRHALTLDN